MNCKYECPFGEIISNWEKIGKTITFSISVPKGTTANFILPFQYSKKATFRKMIVKTSSFKRIKNKITVLKEGKYEIISQSIN